jgi:hypothetical protein
MTRRSVFRVLLSLLLLLSQQMAMSHVVSHWSGVAQAAEHQRAARDDGLSRAIAQDQACSQCLAFAQIASALGNTPCVFAPPAAGPDVAPAWAARAFSARTICPFDSRAPPVLA